jgi:hypothetical protein
MAAMGLGIPGISAVAVGLCVASIANAVYLGRRQQERAAAQQGGPSPEPGAATLAARGATP